MSWQNDITQAIVSLTNRLNDITTSAKKIFQLPWQTILNPASKIHISNQLNESEFITVQQILDAALSYRKNQLVEANVTVDGNDVTVDSGAKWIINNVNYELATDFNETIPYAETGYTRNDILVGDESNLIYRIVGPETEGISPTPNTPLNTVLVTIINVTDATIGYVPPIIGTITTDDVINNSDVDGETTTEAFNALNTGKENVANKATDFTTVNNTLYPSTQAVSNATSYKRTIAQIRALSGTLPNTNFYTTDLGQEGNWYYDSTDVTSTDNTGTILVTSDGKRIKRDIGNEISVKWFGAKGDETNDDTAEIQSALDVAYSMKSTGRIEPHNINVPTVFFPHGIYLISNTITLEGYAKITSEKDAILYKNNNGDGLVIKPYADACINIEYLPSTTSGNALVMAKHASFTGKIVSSPENGIYGFYDGEGAYGAYVKAYIMAAGNHGAYFPIQANYITGEITSLSANGYALYMNDTNSVKLYLHAEGNLKGGLRILKGNSTEIFCYMEANGKASDGIKSAQVWIGKENVPDPTNAGVKLSGYIYSGASIYDTATNLIRLSGVMNLDLNDLYLWNTKTEADATHILVDGTYGAVAVNNSWFKNINFQGLTEAKNIVGRDGGIIWNSEIKTSSGKITRVGNTTGVPLIDEYGNSLKFTGGYNTGHPIVGLNHIWQDFNNILRTKTSAPSSNADGTAVQNVISGTTGSRPIGTDYGTGLAYFDTTIGKPIWWNGSTWLEMQSLLTNPITGTGIANNVGKWITSTTHGNGVITDTGSLVTIGSNTSVTGSTTATSFIKSGGTSAQFLKADGSVDSSVISGSYTPTLSNLVNCSSLTLDSATYMRVGNVVTVSCFYIGSITSATTLTSFDISLPINRASLTSVIAGFGSVVSPTTATIYGGYASLPSGSQIARLISFSTAGTGSNNRFTLTFQYDLTQ